MAAKELWKGNEAVAEAALRAGCKFFFGYPITPQSELPEYLAKHMAARGGCFLQAESEIAAINMVYGAAGAGARVMTSSSSPGISLKQEGITYIASAELPAVIVNMMRGGPGLGNISPGQADYFQATRGGGNGDYRTIVLAPATIQEAVDLTMEAFDLADEYRNPVLLLADGMIGQMMEAVEWREPPAREHPPKTWATDGTRGEREHNIINSLYLDAETCTMHNRHLTEKIERMEANEVRFEVTGDAEPEIVLVAYGTMSRVARAAMVQLAADGIKTALLRPISLWPFPYEAVHALAQKPSVKELISVELSMGQMIDDVKIGAAGAKPVSFAGVAGGVIPAPDDIANAVRAALGR